MKNLMLNLLLPSNLFLYPLNNGNGYMADMFEYRRYVHLDGTDKKGERIVDGIIHQVTKQTQIMYDSFTPYTWDKEEQLYWYTPLIELKN